MNSILQKKSVFILKIPNHLFDNHVTLEDLHHQQINDTLSIPFDANFNDEFNINSNGDTIINNAIINNTIVNTANQSIIYDKIPQSFTGIENWPKTTNLLCWTCSLNFDTTPVFIPLNLENSASLLKMGVYGNFCSFNCAMDRINRYHSGPEQEDMKNNLRRLYFIFKKTAVFIVEPVYDKTKMKQYCGPLGQTIDEWRVLNTKNDRYLTV